MNQPTELTVKFLRLNSGEDVVCETIVASDKTIKIIKPLKVIYSMSEHSGMISVSLIQWIFPKISTDESFDLDVNHILVSSDASIDMTTYYYKSLDKIEKTIDRTGHEKHEREDVYDDYEDDPEDVSDDELNLVKEMLEESILKKRKLH